MYGPETMAAPDSIESIMYPCISLQLLDGATGCPICICQQHLGSLAHFQMIGTIIY